jgi:beta-lactam-binding protein with PASTA domain
VIKLRYIKYIWIANILIVVGWLVYLFVIPYILYNKEVAVPDLTGLSEEKAVEILKDNNIDANIYYIDDDEEKVKYSIPSFGSSVKKHGTISLYIGRIKLKYYESFTGLMLEQNQDYINEYCKENAISYTVIYEENNDEIPGVILEQSLTSYDIVNPGDELVFKVSSSNQYIQMPSLSGLSVSDALEFLNKNDLKANLIYYYAPIDEDIIISQSIEEGIVIKKGNKHIIDLYVSKGMPYDLTSINIDNFIEVLIDLNINYDIIVVESNIESNKAIAVVGYSDDDSLAYSLYISK